MWSLASVSPSTNSLVCGSLKAVSIGPNRALAGSRVELRDRVRVVPEDLAHAGAGPVVGVAPDDERLVRAHVEDREHGAAPQRVRQPDLGDAVGSFTARPELRDPVDAGAAAELELDLPAHLAVGALDDAGGATDPRYVEGGHRRLRARACGHPRPTQRSSRRVRPGSG